jgi:hypothetical protein
MSRHALPAVPDAIAAPLAFHDGTAQPAHPSQGSRARRGPAGALALIERAHAASTPRFVSSVLVLGGLCVGLVTLVTCTQP